MKSLTAPCLCFEEFIYFAEKGDTFFSLQEKFLIPAKKLMSDNPCVKSLKEGVAIYVDASKGKTRLLTPDSDIFDVDTILEKNGLKRLYPFQRVYY